MDPDTLGALDKLVGVLAERIQRHGNDLSKSESMTRYALIDPILSLVGWDLANPDQVRPEDTYQGGRPDYVMFHQGSPVIVVEAKRLNAKLIDQADNKDSAKQARNYALDIGCSSFVVTNGDQWMGYDLLLPGDLSEKRTFEFNVTGGRASLELLWLWPGNFRGQRAKSIPKPRFEASAPTLSRPSAPSPAGANHTYVTGKDALRVISGMPRDATYAYVEDAHYRKPQRNSIYDAIYEAIKNNKGAATGHSIVASLGSLNNGRGFKRPRAERYMEDNDVVWYVRSLVQKERLHVRVAPTDE